jgi:hypothetical protein
MTIKGSGTDCRLSIWGREVVRERTVRNYRFYQTKLSEGLCYYWVLICHFCDLPFSGYFFFFPATKFYYSLLDICRHAPEKKRKLAQFLLINLCGSEFRLQVLLWWLNWKCLIFFIPSAFSLTSSSSSSRGIRRSEVDSELYIFSSYFLLFARLPVIRFLSTWTYTYTYVCAHVYADVSVPPSLIF